MAHNHQNSTISKSPKMRFTHHICTWLKAMQQEKIQNFSHTGWPAKVIVVAHLEVHSAGPQGTGQPPAA